MAEWTAECWARLRAEKLDGSWAGSKVGYWVEKKAAKRVGWKVGWRVLKKAVYSVYLMAGCWACLTAGTKVVTKDGQTAVNLVYQLAAMMAEWRADPKAVMKVGRWADWWVDSKAGSTVARMGDHLADRLAFHSADLTAFHWVDYLDFHWAETMVGRLVAQWA